ncbi:hypothetical protein BD324DRAFT_620582 [Kockovaella imperatae]|uniref:Uncharacterized protein n=1 Tax=Kockovaella imperatae TaxID=4999 RepID=A0A1Y1ULK5_9TREE|nr:hypothetical protein BD324DRAFT_620582 [Kockovaella imperatae]ORX38366.1 hypothetical protein BD324DRAFT_620582 [Kockovaella imperatae]
MSQPRPSVEPLLPRPATATQDSDNADEDEFQPQGLLSNMGISISTARWLAPASFIFDFACQMYGMNSSPNMKQIHDRHPAAFSPQPFAIAGFFGPQQIAQLLWLRELYRSDAEVERGTVRYVPWYALGNAMIGIWMFLWNGDNMKGADIPVIINTLTQVYYMLYLRDPAPNTYQAKLTNIINITFAGIGILDIFHNTSVAWFEGVTPNALTTIGTMAAAPLTALFSPLLFGACIAYDLFGVAIGQHQLAQKALDGLGGGGGEGWAKLMGGLGLGVAAIVGARGWGGARWL